MILLCSTQESAKFISTCGGTAQVGDRSRGFRLTLVLIVAVLAGCGAEADADPRDDADLDAKVLDGADGELSDPSEGIGDDSSEDLELGPGCAPVHENDLTCDRVDDDCDNAVDDDYVGTTTYCGLGACVARGQLVCVNGSEVDSCTPKSPAPNDSTCDGVDDDCDDQTDEDYVQLPTGCGVGACAAIGRLVCDSGDVLDSCATKSRTADADSTCDSIDDDCDGFTDEDIVATTTTCGVGACSATGSLVCNAGHSVDTCAASAPQCPPGACGDDGCGGTCGACVLVAPTALAVSVTSETQVDLLWRDNSADEDAFVIERRPFGGSFEEVAEVGPGVTGFSDSGLPPAPDYVYRVRAKKGAERSLLSNEAKTTLMNVIECSQRCSGSRI